jgi:hypothetical protein
MTIHRINKDGSRKVTLKPCKNCGNLGHTTFTCPKKPRKTMQRTRMKPIGKVGKKTITLNKVFLDSIPEDELYCVYCQYLGIDNLLTRRTANAEHYLSRARHPELRHDLNNLVVSCSYHNKLKGSQDGPEFLKILDKQKEGK